MFAKFNEMIENEDNSKTDLLENLKELARTISVFDQMKVTGELRANLKEIQGPLREEFFKVYAQCELLKSETIMMIFQGRHLILMNL